jgi:diguanylate cyclase (GGDEF)-like protein
MQSDSKGIFVTKHDKYYGFINLNNLLSLSYKRNLEIAENKNPLTKLPGNNQLEKFIDNIFESQISSQIVYFDFNDFKPFNDQYGFRQGDRAILMFAEILQKRISKDGFIAHIGGDDFVAIFVKKDYIEIFNLIKSIQDEFKNDAISLYNEEDIKNRYMLGKDRFGTTRKFKLLSVSCAIIQLISTSTLDGFNSKLGDIKKASKLNDHPLGATIIV